ncbi:rnhA operon protein [Natrialbaceae archaeon A-arb3/5]
MSDQTGPNGGTASNFDEAGDGDELPDNVVEEAERLTRLERSSTDENEATAHDDRRERLLSRHEFTSRIRDDGDAVLVLHPTEWTEDGVIRTERIEDISRAVEIPLEGTGDPDDWETVDERNRELVERVRERHGEVHGENAAVLADFASNHYAKSIESLTGSELTEFCTEYFVRNAWPSASQHAAIEDSLDVVYETAGEPVPEFRIR